MSHLSVEQVCGLVRGEPAGLWLEQHVDGCDACAEAVTREARLELRLRTLFREQRCGTRVRVEAVRREEEVGCDRPGPRLRGAPPAWTVVMVSVALSLMLFWAPAFAPEPGAGTEAPCAGVEVDGGAGYMAAVGVPALPAAHGTP